MSFILESLRSEGFSWKAALSLVSAAELSYDSVALISRTANEVGGFQHVEPIIGEVSGFMAAAEGTAVVCLGDITDIGRLLTNFDTVKDSWNGLGTLHRHLLSAAYSTENLIIPFINAYGHKQIWFAGHGIGGVIGTIIASSDKYIDKLAGVYTFGQPAFADRQAAAALQDRLDDRYIRFVNDEDIVARVLPNCWHFGKLILFDSTGSVKEAADAPEGRIIPSSMTPEEFDRLQSELQQLFQAIEKNQLMTQNSEIASGSKTKRALADISAEGLYAGIGEHAIGKYRALINRRTSSFTTVKTLSYIPNKRLISSAVEAGLESSVNEISTPDSDIEVVPVLIRLRSAAPWTAPEGIHINSQIGSIVSAQGSKNALEALHNHPEVSSIAASRDAGIEELANALPFIGADEVHDGTLQHPITGTEIVEKGDKALIGIIDSGVDILHQSFRDSDGNLRILAIWDQRDSSTDRTPHQRDSTHFSQNYGRLYLRDELSTFTEVTAKPGLRDTRPKGKHGTHVASIAAGRMVPGGPGSGVAPDAQLVVVIPHMRTSPENPPSLGYSASHVDALHFLRQVSNGGTIVISDNLPMAVNVSLGMNAGAHDGSSPLEAAFDQITNNGRDPGFVVVKSAGNEFGLNGHVRLNLFEGVQEITWTTTNKTRSQDYIEVWYSSRDHIEFKLTDPLGHVSDVISIDTLEFEKSIGGMFWQLILEPLHPDNAESLLRISIVSETDVIPEGLWRLEITGVSIRSEEGFLDAWVERDHSRAVKFNNSNNLMTLSIPGTAESVICIAACHSQDPLRRAEFSSAGLTRKDGPKPELCAPGASIVAAHAGTKAGTIRMSGTSMAAPMATGALALALSHRHKLGQGKQLNAKQYREKLIGSLANFSRIHNEHFGYGRLDVKAFFEQIK